MLTKMVGKKAVFAHELIVDEKISTRGAQLRILIEFFKFHDRHLIAQAITLVKKYILGCQCPNPSSSATAIVRHFSDILKI
jgi:hypothetical protein